MQSVRSQLPDLKLVVMWPDNLTADTVPAGLTGVLSWAEFIATGAAVDDTAFAARVATCDAAKYFLTWALNGPLPFRSFAPSVTLRGAVVVPPGAVASERGDHLHPPSALILRGRSLLHCT